MISFKNFKRLIELFEIQIPITVPSPIYRHEHSNIFYFDKNISSAAFYLSYTKVLPFSLKIIDRNGFIIGVDDGQGRLFFLNQNSFSYRSENYFGRISYDAGFVELYCGGDSFKYEDVPSTLKISYLT